MAKSKTVPESAAPTPFPTTGGKSVWRKRLILCVCLIVVISAAIWLRHWWNIGRFIEETDDAFVGGETTMIASRVPGLIAAVAVTDNQSVHAGDLLAQIDPRDFQSQVARAQAVVESQEALLENLDAAADMQAAVINQARAQTAATAAEKRRADPDVARLRSLLKSRAVSEQEFQVADAVGAKAEAADQASKAGLIAAERQLAVIATQKKQARAALDEARAGREIARLNLSFTEVRAPIDGFIGNRRARVGAYAAIGSQLMSVVPAAGLWVEANFKESQLAHLHAGQHVIIKAAVWPGVEFEGCVESLAPATGAEFSLLPPENATGNFTKIVQRVPVRIRLVGEAARLGQLRPGLSVLARVNQR